MCVEGRRLRPSHERPHHDGTSGHQRSLKKGSPLIALPNAIPMSFSRGVKQPSRDPDGIPLDRLRKSSPKLGGDDVAIRVPQGSRW